MSQPLLHATLSTSSPSLTSTSPVFVVVFLSEPRPVVHVSNYSLRRSTARWHFNGIPSSTGYEPKRIELNRILVKPQNQVIDDQDDIEEIGVKKLSYSESVHDSAESIATRTSKTSNYVRCLLHHCINGNERKMKDKRELITLNERA